MGVECTESAAKHGIRREDALYVIAHATGSADLEGGRTGERTTVFVGPAHEQSERYLEVIVAIRPPRTMVIFHVMELSDLFRHLLQEGT